MSQITTHALDTALGRPAAGLPLSLHQWREDGQWQQIAAGITDDDGRAPDLAVPERLAAGRYRMHFDTGAYFSSRGVDGFYPYVDVVFNLDDSGDHYHVPLLLSPFGYSTYRGS
jgi:5-hydroxyisourate hydrolase